MLPPVCVRLDNVVFTVQSVSHRYIFSLPVRPDCHCHVECISFVIKHLVV